MLVHLSMSMLVFLSVAGGSLDDDAAAVHPGHLLPFGSSSAGPRLLVDEVSSFPSPSVFIKDYVKASRPVLMKGVFKSAPAYSLWDDEYFRTIYEPADSLVNVETTKKENRSQEMLQLPFKTFVSRYLKESIYMVDSVPEHLERDVPVAPSLQCPALLLLLSQDVMWMSSGGTKSVVHHDDLENLNCLVRGRKQLFLVDPKKFPDAVPMDKSHGTFSSLDVDSVDFLKYPSMANVGEYHLANMTAGDCLFIPFRWIHQVRSFDRNIAVNLWWDHDRTLNLDENACQDVPESGLSPSFTLADIDFELLAASRQTSLKEHLLKAVAEKEIDEDYLKSGYFEDGYKDASIFEGLAPSWKIRGEKKFADFFLKMDLDSDGRISQSELTSLNDDEWEKLEELENQLDEFVVQVAATRQTGAGGQNVGKDEL